MDKEEFEMKKKLIDLTHKHNMKELEYSRETMSKRYENELGTIRFRSVAIQREKTY